MKHFFMPLCSLYYIHRFKVPIPPPTPNVCTICSFFAEMLAEFTFQLSKIKHEFRRVLQIFNIYFTTVCSKITLLNAKKKDNNNRSLSKAYG